MNRGPDIRGSFAYDLSSGTEVDGRRIGVSWMSVTPRAGFGGAAVLDFLCG